MARRNEAQREQMRVRILDLAREMIAEDGSGAISARTLAKRAGLLPGSLYNLFPSIEEIRLAVLGDVLRRLVDAIESVPQDLDPAARLHAYARAYLAFVEANVNAWSALFEYRRNATVDAPDWYRAFITQLTARITSCFVALSPQRSSSEAQRQARLLWAGLYGLSSLENEGRLENLMNEDFGTLVDGLVATHTAAFRSQALPET